MLPKVTQRVGIKHSAGAPCHWALEVLMGRALLLTDHTSFLEPMSGALGPSVLVSQCCLLPAKLSDMAFSKTQSEWKQILFGEFCYTLHQGWLQNQAWGSLLMLMIIIITTVYLASIHSFNQALLTICQEPAQCWAFYFMSTSSKHLKIQPFL